MASRINGGNLSNTFLLSETAPTLAVAELTTQSPLAAQVLAEYSPNCYKPMIWDALNSLLIFISSRLIYHHSMKAKTAIPDKPSPETAPKAVVAVRPKKPAKVTTKPAHIIRDAAAPPLHFTREQIEMAVLRASAKK